MAEVGSDFCVRPVLPQLKKRHPEQGAQEHVYLGKAEVNWLFLAFMVGQ